MSGANSANRRIEASIEHLVKRGKRQGYLTYEDLNKLVPDEAVSFQKIDLVLNRLEEERIELVDESEAERIDRETGLLADANGADAYFQPFLEDTVPTESAANQMSLSDTQRSLREEAFQ